MISCNVCGKPKISADLDAETPLWKTCNCGPEAQPASYEPSEPVVSAVREGSLQSCYLSNDLGESPNVWIEHVEGCPNKAVSAGVEVPKKENYVGNEGSRTGFVGYEDRLTQAQKEEIKKKIAKGEAGQYEAAVLWQELEASAHPEQPKGAPTCPHCSVEVRWLNDPDWGNDPKHTGTSIDDSVKRGNCPYCLETIAKFVEQTKVVDEVSMGSSQIGKGDSDRSHDCPASPIAGVGSIPTSPTSSTASPQLSESYCIAQPVPRCPKCVSDNFTSTISSSGVEFSCECGFYGKFYKLFELAQFFSHKPEGERKA